MFSNTKKETPRETVSTSSSIISKETSLEGNLHTTGNLRIEGKVVGSVQAKAKVVLGNTAWIKGDIVAQNVEIGGEVQGTVKTFGLLTLRSTAIVRGDIATTKLIFEEGAKFNGKCHMDSALKEDKQAPTPEMLLSKNQSKPAPHAAKASLSQ